MKDEQKTIDLTPSPNAMRQMLKLVVESSTKEEDREWARAELKRIKHVKAWAKS